MNAKQAAPILVGMTLLGSVCLLGACQDQNEPAQVGSTSGTAPTPTPTAIPAPPASSTNFSATDINNILNDAHIGVESAPPNIDTLYMDSATLLVRSRDNQGRSIFATIDTRTRSVSSYLPYGAFMYAIGGNTFVFFEPHRVLAFRPGWTFIGEIPQSIIDEEETFDGAPTSGTEPGYVFEKGILKVYVYAIEDVHSLRAEANPDHVAQPIRTIELVVPSTSAGMNISSDEGPEIGE